MKRLIRWLYPRTLRKFLLMYVGLAVFVMLMVWIWPLLSECRSNPSFLNYFWHAKNVEFVSGGGCFFGLDEAFHPFRAVRISDRKSYSLLAEACNKCGKTHGAGVTTARVEVMPVVQVWVKFKDFLGIDFGPIE